MRSMPPTEPGNAPANTDRLVGNSKLLGRMRDDIRRRHYSIRTEQAYLDWAKRYILFHGKRHPNDLGEAEITTFLNHLAVERNVAASTQNQALNALLFQGISKNSIKAMMARRKSTRKRSLHGLNEHFECFSNAASALSADF